MAPAARLAAVRSAGHISTRSCRTQSMSGGSPTRAKCTKANTSRSRPKSYGNKCSNVLYISRQFEQPARSGQRVCNAGEPQAMPGHRVVAGGDRNAGEALELRRRLGDAQAGAGDEDRLDAGRFGEADDPRFDRGDGNARGVAIVAAVEGGGGGDVDSAGAEIGDERGVDLGRIRGQEPDRLCAKRAEGGEGGGDRGRAGDAWAAFMDFVEHRRFAEGHRRRRAAERDHVELEARQNQRDARRDPRPNGAQGVGPYLGVVEDARLVERDAGQIDEGAELVLHRLVGRQNDEADRRAPAETAVELGGKNAEINGRWGRAGKVERHGLASLLSGGHEAVHGDGWRAAGDEVGRNARRAVRHGPPNVAVAAIEDEVLESAL